MLIKLAGYNHIDVGTAAFGQNDGRPEAESLGLAAWADRVLAKYRRKHRKH